MRKICPTCGHKKKLTQHHIFPQRFFGDVNVKVGLCEDCHQGELEHIIPEDTQLTKAEYILLFMGFLKLKSRYCTIDERLIGRMKSLYFMYRENQL